MTAVELEADNTKLRQAVAKVGCRPLVLIDIENLVSGAQHRTALEARISELAAVLPAGAMVRVAAYPTIAPAVWFAPGSESWRKLAPRRGPDASDLTLLETLNEPTPAGCDSLVIGSGDGIFVQAIRKLALPTLVVSLPTSLSTKLQAAADNVAFISPVTPVHRRQRARRCKPGRPDVLNLRDHPAPYRQADQQVSVSA